MCFRFRFHGRALSTGVKGGSSRPETRINGISWKLRVPGAQDIVRHILIFVYIDK